MLEKQPGEQANENIASGEWEGQPARFYTDRIIVKLKRRDETAKGVEEIDADVAAEIPGGELGLAPSPTARMVLSVDADIDIPELAARLTARDDVEWAEPGVLDSAAVTPSDPRFSQQWGAGQDRRPNGLGLRDGGGTVLIGADRG